MGRGWAVSFTADLLHMLLPQGGCVLNLVECYFDESESDSVLCVAGYLFERDSCVAMSQKWQKVLDDHGLKFFHMVECAQRSKQFKKKTKDECIEIQTKLINLIKAHALQGYAVSFELRFAHLVPSAKAHGLEIIIPYSLCCYFSLMSARHWAEKNNYSGRIAYFFESGHRHESESNRIMNAIFAENELRGFYRYISHTFGDKDQYLPLQTGDILAWQWRKYIKDRAKGKLNPRADLLSLTQALDHKIHLINKEFLTDFRSTILKANANLAITRALDKWRWTS